MERWGRFGLTEENSRSSWEWDVHEVGKSAVRAAGCGCGDARDGVALCFFVDGILLSLDPFRGLFCLDWGLPLEVD